MNSDLPNFHTMQKQLAEMALDWGRRRLSAQTGFLHFSSHTSDPEPHQPIPVVENFYFALALMRSHLAEPAQQGKELLRKLLAFQIADGNFPRYLHEFPQCEDHFIGIEIMSAWQAILSDYHAILGTALLAQLEASYQLLLDCCLRKDRTTPLRGAKGLRLAALAIARGHQKEGSAIMKRLEAEEITFYTTHALGDFLLACREAQSAIPSRFVADGFEILNRCYHLKSGTYAGPAFQEFQKGVEPSPTLADLFWNAWQGELPSRLLADLPLHLKGALFFSAPAEFHPETPPFSHEKKIASSHWRVEQRKEYAYSVIGYEGESTPAAQAWQVCRIVWGDLAHVNTIVCQGEKGGVAYTLVDDGFDLHIRLQPNPPDNCREICFAINRHPLLHVLINGKKATLFRLGDLVEIAGKGMKMTLSFQKEKGEGEFTGHLLPGNRPAQLVKQGPPHYEAFDLMLFLKSLRRTGDCVMTVKVRFHESLS